jgi:TolA-binding protein
MKRRLAIVAALALVLVSIPAVAPVSALEEADRLFLVGERALADRFFPVARRALERFVARFPDDARQPRALLMLGKTRLALGDPQAALEALARAQQALSAPTEVREARFWQAEALLRLQRFAEARDAYDEIVRTDAAGPLAADALFGFAWSELELKNPDAAIKAFRDFLSTWPEHAQAPPATFQLARALVEAKRPTEAVPLLTGFAAKYPGSKLIPDAQYLLGWAKYHNGDRQGGLAELAAFAAANPSHPEAASARRLTAHGYARYGDRSQRITAYKALMEQTPASAEAYYEAAAIAVGLGMRAEQEAAWRKLRAEFPDDPLTRKMALDMAAVAYKQKNWKDTVAQGQIAAQSDDPTVSAEAWLLVGEAELKQRRFSQAAKAFESVNAQDDVDGGARFRALAGLGLAREELKDWKAALAAYEAVVAQSPDATLREWARDRVAAVKSHVTKSPAPKRPEPKQPPAKPGGKKS